MLCQPVSMEAGAGKPLLPPPWASWTRDPTYPQPAPLPTPQPGAKHETQNQVSLQAKTPCVGLPAKSEIKVSEARRGSPHSPPPLRLPLAVGSSRWVFPAQPCLIAGSIVMSLLPGSRSPHLGTLVTGWEPRPQPGLTFSLITCTSPISKEGHIHGFQEETIHCVCGDTDSACNTQEWWQVISQDLLVASRTTAR